MERMTKQGMRRLLDSTANVRLVNGCYNVVTAKAEFSKYSLELQVEVTHPALEWQCGKKNNVTLTYWKGYSGVNIDMPDELRDKIEVMRVLGTMGDEEAAALSRGNAACFVKLWDDLGMRD
jgi:hypothetical protein